MTLVRVDQAREAIIDQLKANTNVVALLSDADEVREFNWKGTEFSYPNYRVRIDAIRPFDTCYQELEASVFCFSEQKSSQEAEEMAGTVANEFHDKGFTQDSIRFTHVIAEPIPAIAESLQVWRSQVQLLSLVNLV